MNSDDSHPPWDSTEWENPDRCPFCGAALQDGGAGFVEHTEKADICRARCEAWLENCRDDMGSTWTG